MDKFISEHWTELTALVFSVISLVVSVKSWRKSRAIYAIETMTLREVRGRRDDVVIDQRLEEIKNKLNSGKYTILSIVNRTADNDFQIFLGKIKK